MIKINLLSPEEQPRRKGIDIKMPAVGAFVPALVFAIAVGACATTYFIQQRNLQQLETSVAEAKAEAQRLAPQIARIKQLQREREQLDMRLDAISALDEERYFRVHLLSEIARRTPENCWLTRVEEVSPGQLEIEGITFSNFIVADFMRDLSESDYYRSLDLVEIERGKIQDAIVLNFHIAAEVAQPPIDVASGL